MLYFTVQVRQISTMDSDTIFFSPSFHNRTLF